MSKTLNRTHLYQRTIPSILFAVLILLVGGFVLRDTIVYGDTPIYDENGNQVGYSVPVYDENGTQIGTEVVNTDPNPQEESSGGGEDDSGGSSSSSSSSTQEEKKPILENATEALTSQQPTMKLIDADGQEMEVQIKSIEKDFFMPIFHKTVSKNDDSNEVTVEVNGQKRTTTERQQINEKIALKTADKSYSLYDRFGGDISFFKYYGENTVSTNLMDKVYTAVNYISISGNMFDNIKNVQQILETTKATYKNIFYDSRPELLDANSDVRVKMYSDNCYSVGAVYDLSWANYKLETTKVLFTVTDWFVSDRYLDTFTNLPNIVFTSNVYKTLIPPLLTMLLSFAGMGFIAWLVLRAIKLRGGNLAIRDMVVKLITACISGGLVICLITSPTQFFDITNKLIKIPTTLVNNTLNLTYSDNEIIHSDSTDNQVSAALWKASIFDQWCMAEFGTTYENLYTEKAGKGNVGMPITDETSSLRDIMVPLGGDAKAQNWAALAMSLQSQYHIDAIEDSKTMTNLEDATQVYFPIATKTTNESIYADDFRLIDGMSNISNQPTGDLLSQKYENTRQFYFHSDRADKILLNGILLIPLFVAGLWKILALIRSFLAVIKLAFHALVNAMNPETATLWAGLKATGITIMYYFWRVLIMFIILTLYTNMAVKDGFVYVILYLALAIYILMLKPAQALEAAKKLTPQQIKKLGIQVYYKGGVAKERAVDRINGIRNIPQHFHDKKVLPTLTATSKPLGQDDTGGPDNNPNGGGDDKQGNKEQENKGNNEQDNTGQENNGKDNNQGGDGKDSDKDSEATQGSANFDEEDVTPDNIEDPLEAAHEEAMAGAKETLEKDKESKRNRLGQVVKGGVKMFTGDIAGGAKDVLGAGAGRVKDQFVNQMEDTASSAEPSDDFSNFDTGGIEEPTQSNSPKPSPNQPTNAQQNTPKPSHPQPAQTAPKQNKLGNIGSVPNAPKPVAPTPSVPKPSASTPSKDTSNIFDNLNVKGGK